MHLKKWEEVVQREGDYVFPWNWKYVNNLNIYNRSKNGTNLWDDLIHATSDIWQRPLGFVMKKPFGQITNKLFDDRLY